MVTGIGHVGGYIVRDLLEAGEDVVIFGYFGGNGDPEGPLPDLEYVDFLVNGDLRDRVTVVVGDVSDLRALTQAAEQHDVRSIIHLAAIISTAAEQRPIDAVRVNVEGSANIFELGTRLEMEKVVWASSIEVFGPRSVHPGGYVDDDSPRDPVFTYGATKAMVEKLAERHSASMGLDITGLRLSRVYGFGEHVKVQRGGGTSWMSPLVWSATIGEGPCVVPFGARSVDFHYIEDVSRAFVTALAHRGGQGETYLLHGDLRPLTEAVDFVKRLIPDTDLTLDEADGPLPAGSTISWSRRYDASRAERELGIKSNFTMEEGLFRTINHNRQYVGLPVVEAPKDLKDLLH
jgi:nucleoside-diphosphate-sugar epimerase